MYKLIIWKAIWTDSGPETGTDSYILNYKPTFQDMYKHLSTDMIEITKGYDKDISDRSFDMYIDEESKLKPETKHTQPVSYTHLTLPIYSV